MDNDLVELWAFESNDTCILSGPTASEAPDLTDQSIDLCGPEQVR